MLAALWFAFAPSLVAAKRRPSPSPSPAPTAAPSPTPLSNAARITRLEGSVTAIARAHPGRLGVAIIDLQYDTHVSVHGAELLPLGDVANLVIAFTAYRLADQARLDLDERVMVRRADVRAGSTLALQHPRGGVTYAYWELLRLMLVSDDATARGIVLRRIGGPLAVGGMLHRLGVRGFRIAATATATVGSPDAVAALLAGIADGRFLLLNASSEYLDALAHRAETSDARIVTFPDGRRVVTVALFDASDSATVPRATVLADVAQSVDDAFR